MKQRGPGGRPRKFDEAAVLDAAMKVFWRHGFDGTSMAELQKATGLNPPSLYGAFGSKEQLYRRVLDRYAEVYGFAPDPDLPPREAIERFLHRAAETFSSGEHPRGCMISTAALAVKDGEGSVCAETAMRRAATLRLIRRRLVEAQEGGGLCGGDVDAIARYFGAMVQGMSVQAVDGAGEEELRTMADIAMRIWPEG
ncbi:TetR/AcrR family transcriptional regulator [Salininema proteolyticum]|uniref:TetR/AcrR family transcriptional regulator n=1 Tax=Salininema proteolyticum TaxID=1607685 RepID=A0ABV8U3U7_9ACTN